MAAGKGTRLYPLTLDHPKSLYRLDKNATILQRMVQMIYQYDRNADVIVVTGHMHKRIEEHLSNVTFIHNPFYNVTNSIASLWFAQNHLDAENVVLFDGDILVSEKLMHDYICKPVKRPVVLVDSSIKVNGDYNVEVSGDKVLVMSKNLVNYYGEYAGITKLDCKSALLMRNEINHMVEAGFFDQWYEDALVQLIFKNDFSLYYHDICNYEWTEVDSVNDLLKAREIFKEDFLKKSIL